jgi:hypothetical protein
MAGGLITAAVIVPIWKSRERAERGRAEAFEAELRERDREVERQRALAEAFEAELRERDRERERQRAVQRSELECKLAAAQEVLELLKAKGSPNETELLRARVDVALAEHALKQANGAKP